jgi:hypothetical protein
VGFGKDKYDNRLVSTGDQVVGKLVDLAIPAFVFYIYSGKHGRSSNLFQFAEMEFLLNVSNFERNC